MIGDNTNVKVKQWLIGILGAIVILIALGVMWNLRGDKLIRESGKVFVTYRSRPSYGTVKETESEYYISLTTDGILTAGYHFKGSNQEISSATQLSSSDVHQIRELIKKYNMLGMKQDLSTSVCDGSYCYFDFELEGGKTYTVGGLAPSEKRFDFLLKILADFVTDEMKNEINTAYNDVII